MKDFDLTKKKKVTNGVMQLLRFMTKYESFPQEIVREKESSVSSAVIPQTVKVTATVDQDLIRMERC